MSIKQAVNQALQFVDGKKKDKELFWAVPIVSELNKLESSLLIKWCGKCIHIYVRVRSS